MNLQPHLYTNPNNVAAVTPSSPPKQPDGAPLPHILHHLRPDSPRFETTGVTLTTGSPNEAATPPHRPAPSKINNPIPPHRCSLSSSQKGQRTLIAFFPCTSSEEANQPSHRRPYLRFDGNSQNPASDDQRSTDNFSHRPNQPPWTPH